MISMSTILEPLLQLWYLLPIVIVVAFFRTPLGKGIIGEFLVNIAAKLKLDKNKYHTIEVVVDRMVVSNFKAIVKTLSTGETFEMPNPDRSRLADSVELCLKNEN